MYMKQHEYVYIQEMRLLFETLSFESLQWECTLSVADSRKWRTLDEEVSETAWIAGKSITQSCMNNLSSVTYIL